MQPVETFCTEHLSARQLDELRRMNRDPEVMAALGGVRPGEETERYPRNKVERRGRHGFGIRALRDGLQEIAAISPPPEPASQRMKKTGFEYERDVVRAGLPRVLYRITASGWEKVNDSQSERREK